MVGMDFKRSKSFCIEGLLYLCAILFSLLLSYIDYIVILLNEEGKIFGQLVTMIKLLNLFTLFYIFIVLRFRKTNYNKLLILLIVSVLIFLNYHFVW